MVVKSFLNREKKKIVPLAALIQNVLGMHCRLVHYDRLFYRALQCCTVLAPIFAQPSLNIRNLQLLERQGSSDVITVVCRVGRKSDLSYAWAGQIALPAERGRVSSVIKTLSADFASTGFTTTLSMSSYSVFIP